jgi:hypothetical protein
LSSRVGGVALLSIRAHKNVAGIRDFRVFENGAPPAPSLPTVTVPTVPTAPTTPTATPATTATTATTALKVLLPALRERLTNGGAANDDSRSPAPDFSHGTDAAARRRG